MDQYITVRDASLHKALAYGYTTEHFNLIDGSHYKRVLDYPVYRNIPFQERRWMSERWTWETLFPHESLLFPGIKPRWHGPPNYLGLPEYEPTIFTISSIACVPAPIVAIDPPIFHNASASASLASSSPTPTPTPTPYLPKPARIASHDIPLPSIEAVTPTPTPTPTPKPPHSPTLPRAIHPCRRQTPFQPTNREWTSGWSPISPNKKPSISI
ncbi:hypothetical protein EYC80_006803 [Monilinia laxa]|uniref:Uncharacterized protein n=1 Tax=Monilinia laxa TaxID=61186 RepID=A0A5N6JZN0_MONLA|nr:hypothetical protein EYC80_006803 [Monilinia laxa]